MSFARSHVPGALKKKATVHDLIVHVERMSPSQRRVHKNFVRELAGHGPLAYFGKSLLQHMEQKGADLSEVAKYRNSAVAKKAAGMHHHEIVHELETQPGGGFGSFFKSVGSTLSKGAKHVVSWGKSALGHVNAFGSKAISALGGAEKAMHLAGDVSQMGLGLLAQTGIMDQGAAMQANQFIQGARAVGGAHFDRARSTVQKGLDKVNKTADAVQATGSAIKERIHGSGYAKGKRAGTMQLTAAGTLII